MKLKNMEIHLVVWSRCIKVDLHSVLQPFQSFFLQVFKQLQKHEEGSKEGQELKETKP